MSSKTRKLIWSVPLMATLAVVGALAVFVALGLPNAEPAEAQDAFNVEPTEPQNITLDVGNGEITAVIQQPTNLGVPEFTAYKLQYNQSSSSPAADDSGWTDVTDPIRFRRNGDGEVTVTGLENGETYYFRAAVTLGTAMGPYRQNALDTETPAAVRPSAPIVTIEQRSTTTIEVSWTVADEGGMDIESYTVDITPPDAVGDPPLAPECAALNPATATSTICSNLVAGTMYTVTVTADNTISTGTANPGMRTITMSSQVDITKLPFPAVITSDSSTGGGAPELKVVIDNLASDLPVGSSVVLYLEDDYQEPSSIPASSVYFVADDDRSEATGNGSRVYVTVTPKLGNDAYFDATKSDISIRVFIPDMCTNATDKCEGANGPEMGQRLTLVIEDTSGIKNPSESGKHSAAVRVLGPTDSLPGPTIARADASASEMMDGNIQGGTGSQAAKFVLLTVAKVKLDDNNNKRGYELLVTGTGYNDGTTATAYVLSMPTAAQWWDSLDCGEMNMVAGSMDTEGNGYCRPYAGLGSAEMTVVQTKFAAFKPGFKLGAKGCDVVVANGTSIGTATVGKDDTAAIPVTVTVPIFKPGKVNYICVSDGESRGSGADVEIFELEDSIRVVPMEVNAGDTVTLFAEDFMPGLSFKELKLSGVKVSPSTDEEYVGLKLQAAGIGSDGSAIVTFVMPPTIDGNAIKGTIRVDGTWTSGTGDDVITATSNTLITVKPAGLSLTKTEARANESITIQGSGFSNTSVVERVNITIDDVPLLVDADSLRDDVVKISNGGQFVATIYLWPASGTTNPALVTGIHTIRVEDGDGFVGTTNIAIIEPSITVVPLVAGPRDIVVIRGENFPVDNVEGGAVNAVTITVNDSRERNYSEIPDGSGRFTVEHRVSSNVAIPSVATIKATYGTEITKTASFDVPEAIITVEPALAAPGDSLTLSVGGMPVYASVDSITIGGREALGNQNINTDREGAVTAEGIVVPGLDPGIFSVQLEVNDIVAIGQVEVVSEGPTGLANPLPAAMEAIGDELVRVFYFNGVDKTWSFFDPRPEFDGLNTLTEMVNGQPYWILVSEDVDDVVLNDKTRNLTCVGGDCWNQLVW